MFGTDGVRGTPGVPPLDARTIMRLGAATVRTIGSRPKLLAARDTRESGPWIEQHLAAGVAAAGGTLLRAGVLPTPAAAFLTAARRLDGAFVISASHNPFPDNGIKLLTGEGEKASPDQEARLASLVSDGAWNVRPGPTADGGTLQPGAYETFAADVLGPVPSLSGSRIAVDCANGAMSAIAPRVLRAAGFEVVALNDAPDGRNINAGCGSTDPEGLRRAVTARGCRLGVAFDGDGDRVILVDRGSRLADGDAVLFVCARHLAATGRLPGAGVVATVMSNQGLEVALRAAGVAVHRCPVGDRQVLEAMRRRSLVLGGEPSGHIIFSRLLPTGDGLLTVLSVLRIMHETGQELAALTAGLEVYPQVLRNVRVRVTPDVAEEPALSALIADARQALGQEGRVLVRYSGTEPVLRIMMEGRDGPLVQRLADDVAACARARLG